MEKIKTTIVMIFISLHPRFLPLFVNSKSVEQKMLENYKIRFSTCMECGLKEMTVYI
jgi:hypothetical protein